MKAPKIYWRGEDKMYKNFIYRKPRLKMESKHYTKPGKVNFFTKANIEAFIREKADATAKHEADIQEANKCFALERDKNAKPGWCYMTKKEYCI